MKSSKDKNHQGMTRKEALKYIGGLALGPWIFPSGLTQAKPIKGSFNSTPLDKMTWPFELPALPYAEDALEPVIDRQTMRIHHGKHHQGYTNNLNNALKDYPALQSKPIGELLSNLEKWPEEVRTAIRNNGGGFYNHSLFWPLLDNSAGRKQKPSGKLAEAINRDFGSVSAFKQEFTEAAGSVFGSGWAWLAVSSDNQLQVQQTANQDTVLMAGLHPVLGIDVWEHAYYLKYQNRRSEYIRRFWDIVNWEQAETNYEQGLNSE